MSQWMIPWLLLPCSQRWSSPNGSWWIMIQMIGKHKQVRKGEMGWEWGKRRGKKDIVTVNVV